MGVTSENGVFLVKALTFILPTSGKVFVSPLNSFVRKHDFGAVINMRRNQFHVVRDPLDGQGGHP